MEDRNRSVGTLVLLEWGSNSLKVHFRMDESGDWQSLKFPWRLGRDIYETGQLSDETLHRAIGIVADLVRMGFSRSSMLAIATEGLRDAANRTDLLGQIQDRLQLKVRVITGREEASLLAHGYLRSGGPLPAYLMDVGGGSLQLVSLSEQKTVLRDSLPLGAIRLHCLGEEEGKPWNRAMVEEHIEQHLENACVMKTQEVIATGGTVKAITTVTGSRIASREQVDELVERVARDGPPPVLKPDRGAIFLPGLLAVAGVLRHTGATTLRYLSIPVGRIFLDQLVARLGVATPAAGKDALAENMRLTRIIRRRP